MLLTIESATVIKIYNGTKMNLEISADIAVNWFLINNTQANQ